MSSRIPLLVFCLGSLGLSTAHVRDLTDEVVLYQSKALLHTSPSEAINGKMGPSRTMTQSARKVFRKSANMLLKRLVKKLDIESDTVNVMKAAISSIIAEWAINEYKKPKRASFLGLANDVIELCDSVFSQEEVVNMETKQILNQFFNVSVAAKEVSRVAERLGLPDLTQKISRSVATATQQHGLNPLAVGKFVSDDLKDEPVIHFLRWEAEKASLHETPDEADSLIKAGKALEQLGFPPSIVNLVQSLRNITNNDLNYRQAIGGAGDHDYVTNPEGELSQVVIGEIETGFRELGFPSSVVDFFSAVRKTITAKDLNPEIVSRRLHSAIVAVMDQLELPEGMIRLVDFLWQAKEISNVDHENPYVNKIDELIFSHTKDVAKEIGVPTKGWQLFANQIAPAIVGHGVKDWSKFWDEAIEAIMEVSPPGISRFTEAYRSTPGPRSPEDTIRNVTKMLREVNMNGMADLTAAIEPFIQRRLKPDANEFFTLVPKILRAEGEIAYAKSIVGGVHNKLMQPIADLYHHTVDKFTENMPESFSKRMLKESFPYVETFLSFWVAARLQNKPFRLYVPMEGVNPFR